MNIRTSKMYVAHDRKKHLQQRFTGCLPAMAGPVTYLDPLQGSSNKVQKARVRQRSLTVPTAAWWTQTKHNVSATEDIKKSTS